jgi:hypothetical protein
MRIARVAVDHFVNHLFALTVDGGFGEPDYSWNGSRHQFRPSFLQESTVSIGSVRRGR